MACSALPPSRPSQPSRPRQPRQPPRVVPLRLAAFAGSAAVAALSSATSAAAAAAAAAPPAEGPRCSSGKACPHVMMVLVDDVGWNNVPWHNPDLAKYMPFSLNLTRQGIELDRHYTYLFCSPSRSSLMSGRLPHRVNQFNRHEDYRHGGIAEGMATIPRKLKGAGYATHAVGKWHLGSSTSAKIPRGRGFDTHLGYFAGAEDHWTQKECIDHECALPDAGESHFTDLWHTDRPAYGMNGTAYGDDMYTEFVLRTLEAHDLAKPLFFYVALQNNHLPLQAPQAYLDRFPLTWTSDRRAYAAMGAHWDDSLRQIVGALHSRGMWEHTLLVLASDNGGPVYGSASRNFDHCGGANNWPLLGGKAGNFEGGVRTAAMVAGGFLPDAVRGTKVDGYIHIADWFATFCGLAGVDPADAEAEAAGLPGVDSLDLWPLLLGEAASPRTEIPLSVDGTGLELSQNASALIVGEYKLVGGRYPATFRQAPEWPTKEACCSMVCMARPSALMACGSSAKPSCLFNIHRDPEEVQNLFKEEPEIAKRMMQRLQELRREVYMPQRGDEVNVTAREVWKKRYGGYKGPWADDQLGADHAAAATAAAKERQIVV